MQRNNLISEKLLNARGLIAEGRVDAAKEIIRELQTKYLLRDKVGTNVGKIDRVLTRLKMKISISLSHSLKDMLNILKLSLRCKVCQQGREGSRKSKRGFRTVAPKKHNS